eukprot:TRINITY_DN1170_c0_g1_i2.p1 TRINITY_DN1170_c0_g1~~TRINITY_DN1170_c0_g1_i2.p1  ORF type:complete len:96 (-),score=6.01 TRINITY_DN1170_c0_g1_i2:113-400(-)
MIHGPVDKDTGLYDGLWFITISNKIFESSILDMLGTGGYGVIPLYLTVVLAVGSWVRGMFSDQVSSIIYDDMHNVDALHTMCEHVYISTTEGRLL